MFRIKCNTILAIRPASAMQINHLGAMQHGAREPREQIVLDVAVHHGVNRFKIKHSSFRKWESGRAGAS